MVSTLRTRQEKVRHAYVIFLERTQESEAVRADWMPESEGVSALRLSITASIEITISLLS